MWVEGIKTFLFRTSLLVGMASIAATIIYFTPMPGLDFVTCERPCHELEMPMICRIKLVIEPYQTLSRSCMSCPENSSECFKKYKHCISADGVKRSLLTANRNLPGPHIQVCEDDIIVVDLINRMPSKEMTIHWRGQPVQDSPFMDGVAMVTQCPVSSMTTFQYKFRATKHGTHVWHAHTDGYSDGVVGGFIVRQKESRNKERDLYDVDDTSHVVLVNAWRDGSTRDSLLINGRSLVKDATGEFPGTVFTVVPGQRHRFRLVHAGGRGNHCPVSVSVDSHSLQVIALDGSAVVPRYAHSISLVAGERADFILETNQLNSSYFLRASTTSGCDSAVLRGVAVVRYDGANDADADAVTEQPTTDAAEVQYQLTTHSACDRQAAGGAELCVTDMESTQAMPEVLRQPSLDEKIVLNFGYKALAAEDHDLDQFLWTSDENIPYMNNLTFMYPSSPLLTQPDHVIADLVCDKDRRPARCANSVLCQCVHVVDIPLGASVEILLVDEGGSTDDHVFHLHGYSFHVVGVAQLANQVTAFEAQKLDRVGKLVSRNLVNPVVKDTITVPHKGVAVIRLLADNPGYWLLDNDRSRGLNVVLRVGGSEDVTTTPEDFPKCGSWIGPQFFFI